VRRVKVLIWHGYLLHGTGSNEYTRALARTLARQGHEVTVLSQDPDPDSVDLGGAVALRPRLPGRLPVFVLDRYPDAHAALLPELPRAEVDTFVAAQAEAIRALPPHELLVTNHVLLGAPVGAASGLPFVVKAHGSELEYAMRDSPPLRAWAAETLPLARGVAVGSTHIARVVSELTGLPAEASTVVPPGVDLTLMAPQESRAEALAGLLAESAADGPELGERKPDPGNAARLQAFLAGPAPTVLYVGKLSREKGVHLLVEAMAGMPARLVVVGFGPARAALEQQAGALGVAALFTGPLQHRHLRHLWALADVSVVPSVFPEAFGMVAAEAAATGCPPLVADHSGLAEVAAGLEAHLPAELHLLRFRRDDAADLRRGLARILALSDPDRATLGAGCRAAVAAQWSWDEVARRMLALGEVPSTG
jgi:glycosyltransferase involved in cell wall biosynthesis